MTQKQKTLDPVVKQIAEDHTEEVINIGLRDLALEVNDALGYLPSISNLASSLRRNNAVRRGKRFAWQHNEDHE